MSTAPASKIVLKEFEGVRPHPADNPRRSVGIVETGDDLRCLATPLALGSICSRDSPLLRLFPPEYPALAALRVQSGVVDVGYPQHMGFSILTRGTFGR